MTATNVLQARVAEGETKIARSLINLLGAAVACGADEQVAPLIEENCSLQALIEGVTAYVDVTGDFVLAVEEYLVALETKLGASF